MYSFTARAAALKYFIRSLDRTYFVWLLYIILQESNKLACLWLFQHKAIEVPIDGTMSKDVPDRIPATLEKGLIPAHTYFEPNFAWPIIFVTLVAFNSLSGIVIPMYHMLCTMARADWEMSFYVVHSFKFLYSSCGSHIPRPDICPSLISTLLMSGCGTGTCTRSLCFQRALCFYYTIPQINQICRSLPTTILRA